MFKVVEKPTFTHDVSIMVPCDGGHSEEKLSTTFTVLPAEEAEKFDLNTSQGTVEFLNKAVVQFNDLGDEKGNPVAYSKALRDQMFGHYYITSGLINGYLRAVTKAKTGN